MNICKKFLGTDYSRLPYLLWNGAPNIQLYYWCIWKQQHGRLVIHNSRDPFQNTSTDTCPWTGYSVREELPLPDKPPYTVHLGNLSFDATVGDVNDFFTGCEITSVRIIEDKELNKPKGFGYAEFGTLEGLKQALTLNGTQFQGRNIRISVADPRKFFTLEMLPVNID